MLNQIKILLPLKEMGHINGYKTLSFEKKGGKEKGGKKERRLKKRRKKRKEAKKKEEKKERGLKKYKNK